MSKRIKYLRVFDGYQTGSFASSLPTIVGYNNSGSFHGFIDNVSIYSGGLIDFADKLLLWDDRRASLQSNLYANFSLEEGGGSTVEDSINGATGTIQYGEWQ